MGPPTNAKELKRLFGDRGLSPSRRYGQHFLIEERLLDVIARLGEIGSRDLVVEVGTGPGNLTRRLAEAAGLVVTVEIDSGLFALARDLLGHLGNVRLLHTDVMASKTRLADELCEKIEVALVAPEIDDFKLVANLPYNISTPFLSSLFVRFGAPSLMVLLVQKELAETLVASPGTKDYGPLTILFSLLTEVRIERSVSPEVFWPRPKVDSALVFAKSRNVDDEPVMRAFSLVRFLFSERRKTIGAVLKKLPVEKGGPLSADTVGAILETCGLTGKERAEALEPQVFLTLERALADRGGRD